MLIMMGKNTSSADIIIIESGFRTPNQLMRIGAAATSGIVLAPIATGRRTSRTTTQRAAAKATRTPAVVPMASPPSASKIVAVATCQSSCCSSMTVWPIRDGGGMSRRPSPAVYQLPDDEDERPGR